MKPSRGHSKRCESNTSRPHLRSRKPLIRIGTVAKTIDIAKTRTGHRTGPIILGIDTASQHSRGGFDVEGDEIGIVIVGSVWNAGADYAAIDREAAGVEMECGTRGGGRAAEGYVQGAGVQLAV